MSEMTGPSGPDDAAPRKEWEDARLLLSSGRSMLADLLTELRAETGELKDFQKKVSDLEVAGLMPFADGGTFADGRVTPFARGGAISGPVVFPMRRGAGLMAIGDGESDHWELLQFLRADPVAPGVFNVSMRLRGQAGADAVMPDIWPAGSLVVLLDGVPRQIALPPGARGLERHYRYGPARRPLPPSLGREARAALRQVLDALDGSSGL